MVVNETIEFRVYPTKSGFVVNRKTHSIQNALSVKQMDWLTDLMKIEKESLFKQLITNIQHLTFMISTKF